MEILIRAGLDRLWLLTQDPALHERWDLRFTEIRYLPRASEAEPQQFLYATRLGFGLSIRGTGESVGQRALESGDTTSSLKFASQDPKSLIRQGSGYWRYIPTGTGSRFLTWYDYEVRFGAIGRFIDRFAFRPLIGWATAWSFDCLRLWAEADQIPETSMRFTAIHAVARATIAAVWVWHGLIPKLLLRNFDERVMLTQAGVALVWLPWIGAAEIAFGVLVLLTWNWRPILMVNAALMVLATVAVAAFSPTYLGAAFNPVTLNLAVLALSVGGWLSARNLPSAGRCLRKVSRVQA